MRLFNKVAVVGTGLVGGSLAISIQKKGLAGEVVGVSRHAKNIALAVKIGAIDRGSRELGIIKDADLVVLATPVDSIIKLSRKVSRLIRPDCIVMDVGSTKEKIVSCLEGEFANFVGSHPLAGSEKRSIAYAHAGMFKGSLCILTPTGKTRKPALNKIKKLWESVGARVVLLSPGTHDSILAFVSHLPHVVAFSLINSVPGACLSFASGGLKDTTRIAASDAELWGEIFLSNRKNLLRAIGVFQKRLSDIRSALNKEDARSLQRALREAKIKREKLG